MVPSKPTDQTRRASLVRRSWRLALCVALPWCAALSCGGETDANGGVDTNTNWLRSCAEDSECELGSTCSCGRCTRECTGDADCSDYSETAVCAAGTGACATLVCMPASGSDLGSASEASEARCTHPPLDYTLRTPASCFGRELAECPPGSEPFFDGCGCGCGVAPDYPRRCRSACELAAGDCAETAFEQMPDYATTLAQWSQPDEFASRVAGECSNGRLFSFSNNGTTSEARFFSAEGEFLGLSTSTDDVDSVCWGKSYWPEPVRCERATVTRVFSSGLGVVEGQVLSLPWAEGPPTPLF